MFKGWGRHKANKRYKMFENWLDDILATRQLPQEVAAVNFNIYDGADSTYDLELIGAPGFDANDDDWACEELFTSDLLSLPVTQGTEDWEDGLSDMIDMVRVYMETGRFCQVLEGFEAVGVGHVNGVIEVVYRSQPQVPASQQGLAPPETVPEETQTVTAAQVVQSLFEMEEPVKSAPPRARGAASPERPARQQAPPPTGPVECFKLVRETRAKNIVCRPRQDYGIRTYELLRGIPFSRWAPAFTFVYNAALGECATDYLNNSLGWLVVSQKARQLIEELESQVEYFPVQVVEQATGAPLEGYFVANLLRKQDALCLEESDYTVVQHEVFGSYNAVKKYALRAGALDGADIFKLSEHHEIPVFVTERFKKQMEDNRVTGMAYYPVKMCDPL